MPPSAASANPPWVHQAGLTANAPRPSTSLHPLPERGEATLPGPTPEASEVPAVLRAEQTALPLQQALCGKLGFLLPSGPSGAWHVSRAVPFLNLCVVRLLSAGQAPHPQTHARVLFPAGRVGVGTKRWSIAPAGGGARHGTLRPQHPAGRGVGSGQERS